MKVNLWRLRFNEVYYEEDKIRIGLHCRKRKEREEEKRRKGRKEGRMETSHQYQM